MKKKTYKTSLGTIVYWTNDRIEGRDNVIFLPGLTADHTLFDQQIEYFKDRYNLLVWDAPGHAASRPFPLSFDIDDKVRWLHEILQNEQMTHPYLIGQSMGGYVSQSFLDQYPNEVKGFVSIDSAPLLRQYVTSIEIWLLKNIEPIYKLYPWKLLLKDGSIGVSTTVYGQNLMRKMMLEYNHEQYSKLAGHGYRILAKAMEADRPYTICCPAILICGKDDRAGSTKRYNKEWTKRTGIPIYWIENAGHNSNTDQPEMINKIIEEFIQKENAY